MAGDAEAVKKAVDIVQLVRRTAGDVKLRRGQGGNWTGLCPIHGDKNPSFSVSEDKQIFNCFGCGAAGDVFDFIGAYEGVADFNSRVQRVAELFGLVTLGDTKAAAPVEPKIVATYRYEDESGEMLYEVVRYEPKTFKQRRPDGRGGWTWGLGEVRRPLYRLPQILQSDGEAIWWVEGEKDVATLEALGFVATTCSGGAKAPWQPEWEETLRGRRVVIIPDNDTPGIQRGHEIAGKLRGKAARVAILRVPRGKDATEYVSLGGTSEELQSLLSEALEADYGLLSPAEVVERRYGVAAFLDPTRRPPGVMTGFRDLDEMTVGLHHGELIVLAGRPAMGKTALGIAIAQNIAALSGSVAVFSLEMSSESILDRMICQRARVDYQQWRKGRLTPDGRRALTNAHYEICNLPIRVDDTAALALEPLMKRAEMMRDEIGLCCVVIDYMGLMKSPKAENRNQEMSKISAGLKQMAKHLEIPVLALAQLNRASETRAVTGNRPQLSDLRDSGSIEQDADMVWFVHRPEYYKPNDPELSGLAEILVAKQRNGPVGKVNLTFLKECTAFCDYARYAA